MHHSESVLEGQRLTAGTIESVVDQVYERYQPISDPLASEEFRKEISRLNVKKALMKCLEEAEATL